MSDFNPDLAIVGLGGGGCKFVSAAARGADASVKVVGFDTDAMLSREVHGIHCSILGMDRYEGRGTGGDPVKGRTAVSDDADKVRDAVGNARLAVVVVGLGGGFGSGAAPEVLSILRANGATTLCIATMPFGFEGQARGNAAAHALSLIEDQADALAVVKLDDLYDSLAQLPIDEARARAGERLADAMLLFCSLLTSPGYVSLGPEDISAMILGHPGRCHFAVASADGPGRELDVVRRLGKSAMVGGAAAFGGAQAAMLGIMGGRDLTLCELGEISASVKSLLPGGCEVAVGTVVSAAYTGSVKVVGLFFEAARKQPGDMPADVEQPIQSGRRRARPSALSARTKSKFAGVAATIIDGQDIDTPTFMRLGITLER